MCEEVELQCGWKTDVFHTVDVMIRGPDEREERVNLMNFIIINPNETF